ncbi:SRPBCC family protein [Kitasatospora sp. NPDC048545]|uniref:SRPBCC family protein n=1 Tax=Kitasatospora sp. NPDC048545 TaxID=3157208 RepID=UPI0033C1C7A5
MSTVQQSIDVDVPARMCYDQWTQFEDFPQFMEGVEQVTQLDDRHNHWKTRIAGASREFDTEIVDQLPDERIAWRTLEGDSSQRGVVTFVRLDDSHTRVRLVMEFEPQGMAEHMGAALGMIDRRVKGDLGRFKEFIEHRNSASGAWRGRVTPN